MGCACFTTLMAVLVIAVRMACAPALTVHQSRFRFFESWTATRGVFWHMLVSYIAVAVMVFILTITFFESLHLWRPGVLGHRLDGAPPKRPLRYLRDHWHKAAVPAATYLASIYAWHKLGLGRLLFGVPPGGFVMGAPTFARVAVELTLGVFLYDLLFYPFHLAFHRLRLPAWRRLHSRHHRWAGM